jgi:hypothetical protein
MLRQMSSSPKDMGELDYLGSVERIGSIQCERAFSIRNCIKFKVHNQL